MLTQLNNHFKKYFYLVIVFFLPFNSTSQMQYDYSEEVNIDTLNEISILRQDILYGNINFIAGFLDVINGIEISKSGNYTGVPVLRSFRAEQLPVFYNGTTSLISANPYIRTNYIANYNPADLERVEIIKGPYCVRQSQVMGGMINLIPTSNVVSSDNPFRFGFESAFESNGQGFNNFIEAAILKDKYNIEINAGIRDYGNYLNGNGEEVSSSFSEKFYAAKIGFVPAINHKVEIEVRNTFEKDIMQSSLPVDIDENTSTVINFGYSFKNVSGKIFKMDFKIFGTNSDLMMSNKNKVSFTNTEISSDCVSGSFGGKYEIGLNVLKDAVVYAGLDFNSVSMDGARTRKVHYDYCTGQFIDPSLQFIDFIWRDSKRWNRGMFGEIMYNYSDDLILNVGFRIDYFNSRTINESDDILNTFDEYKESGRNITWSIFGSADIIFDDNITMNLSIGRGSRNPNLSELYIDHYKIGCDNYEYVGNPDLNPETNNQADYSIHYRNKKLFFEVTTYYSFITNFITAAVDTGCPVKYDMCNNLQFAKRFQNIDLVSLAGFEVLGEYELLKGYVLFSEISYTKAQNLSWKEPLPEIPPLVMRSGIKYIYKDFIGELDLKFSNNQNRVSDSFDELPSKNYSIVNLMLKYSFNKYFVFRFSANNIFDTSYNDHLFRQNFPENGVLLYNEKGRSFIIGISSRI